MSSADSSRGADSRPTGDSFQNNAAGSVPDSELGPHNGVVGDVRDYSERAEGGGAGAPMQIWSFVLARHDAAGNPLPSVAVEMRGYQLEGVVRDGDNVEVLGDHVDGILRARRIFNNSTKSEASVPKATLGQKIILGFVILFFLFILYHMISGR